MPPAFTTLTSKTVILPASDIDTDQIIPARFLKVTDKVGLGDKLFHDWRYRADGSPNPDFPLAHPEAEGARILVAGHNFGCGSSREHAPWALVDWGFRAVVSTSFADIFCNNALKNGLLPVTVDAEVHAALVATGPGVGPTLHIDLSAQSLRGPDGQVTEFPIDAFSKRCLLSGLDQLGYILSFADRIDAYEAARAEAES
ncbi:3-isopropylmalate dehydratase small subunit [Haliangium sp.]|uniref:3-isopropylmalate dehydratase small subunit n=1 Tax=Haliangium sp. TaxID=2663208 RepID=UPI003D11DEC3